MLPVNSEVETHIQNTLLKMCKFPEKSEADTGSVFCKNRCP